MCVGTQQHGDHLVHLYVDEPELYQAVAGHLAPALDAGDAALLIATEDHRLGIERALRAGGSDVAGARAAGTLLSLDAAVLARTLLGDDGRIDHEAAFTQLGEVLRKATGHGRPLRAYGEIVAELWRAGDVLKAIELESVWNELGREVPMSLYCAYPAAMVAGAAHRRALEQVCALHSTVLHGCARQGPEAHVTAHLPAELDAPRRARHLAAGALREQGCPEPKVEAAALIVTELASNAVMHARTSISMCVSGARSAVRIAVGDFLPPSEMAGGRTLTPRAWHGLALVEALSSRWGIEALPHGKIVWAELET